MNSLQNFVSASDNDRQCVFCKISVELARPPLNPHTFPLCVQSPPPTGDLHEGQPQNVPQSGLGADHRPALRSRQIHTFSYTRIARMWARSSSLSARRSVNRKVANLPDLRPSFVYSETNSVTPEETCRAIPSPMEKRAAGSERRLSPPTAAACFLLPLILTSLPQGKN